HPILEQTAASSRQRRACWSSCSRPWWRRARCCRPSSCAGVSPSALAAASTPPPASATAGECAAGAQPFNWIKISTLHTLMTFPMLTRQTDSIGSPNAFYWGDAAITPRLGLRGRRAASWRGYKIRDGTSEMCLAAGALDVPGRFGASDATRRNASAADPSTTEPAPPRTPQLAALLSQTGPPDASPAAAE
ncbi:MAG: hypothetical protein ACJA1R_000296, partial [Flavobacteriales bacterium]